MTIEKEQKIIEGLREHGITAKLTCNRKNGVLKMDQSYFQKLEKPTSDAPLWNLPEKNSGKIFVIGGNSQSFKTEIRVSEFLTQNFHLESVKTILPETLKNTLPPLDNFLFLPATDSGSFSSDDSLQNAIDSADFAILLGDFSKNSITKDALFSAVESCDTPILFTRDTIDLLADLPFKKSLANPKNIFFLTLPGLQKLFHSVYYPKVITLSMSLLQLADALHKFTLSYPTTIITTSNNQILIAVAGEVRAIPLGKTHYTPLNLWFGEPAAKLAVYNLFNPEHPLDASISAFFD